ncbi:MAG: hypothetical protein WAS27_03255 [Candidatus Saccharimonadales bacterium]
MSHTDTIILGLIISTIDAAIFLPQAYRAWKLRDNPNKLHGISLTTMWLVVVAYAGWIVWDIQTGRWDAHAYAWIGLPAAAFILAIIYRANKLDAASRVHTCESCGQSLAGTAES